jgi:hypothetical protein
MDKLREHRNCVNKEENNRTVIIRDSFLEVISRKEHSHSPNQVRITGIEVFNHMKRHAVEHPEMPSSQILRNNHELVPSHVTTSSGNSCCKASIELEAS